MHTSIFNKNLRVAYYARVSTQFESQISSLDNQKNHYEKMIKNNPNWTFYSSYIDEGITGTSALKRESFLRMIDDAKKGHFDLIITKEISRFSRNTLESISYTRELLKCGVGVYFENDSICTLSSDSELRLTIMSAIYQDEVRKISERIKFGFKEAINNRKVLGTGNLIGYTKKDGKLNIDEESAEIVRRVFTLYADKKIGIRQISKELEKSGYVNSNGNPYTFSSIKNIITNPKYKGFYCGGKYENIDFRYGKKVKKDKEKWVLIRDENIPAIVDETLWNKANKILKERSKGEAKPNTKYAFSGKIYCTPCNEPYHRTIINKNEAWQCKQKRNGNCDNLTVYTSEICDALDSIFKQEIDENNILKYLIKIYSSFNEQIENPNDERIKNLIKSKTALYSLLLNEIITKDDYALKINVIDEKIDKLNSMENNEHFNENALKKAINRIFITHKDELTSEIVKRIYVKKGDGFNASLTAHLSNGNVYNTSYLKKGSKILNEPEIEKVK